MRTKARTTRKGYDRYQLRRKYLINVLEKNLMMPSEDLRKMPKMNLWQLSSKAVFRVKDNVFPREAYIAEFNELLE